MIKFEELLGKEFDCECGKTHRIKVERMISKDMISNKDLEFELERLKAKKPVFVCDENTLEAVKKDISLEGMRVFILEPRNRVLADIENTKKIINDSKNSDLLVSIGSGTINDITKYAAQELGLNYICIPTAPSVDGYTSPVTALLVNGFKETLNAEPPKTVLVSLRVIKESPIDLIKAGIGDAMAKITARMDWLLSKVINSEYVCDFTWKIMVDDIKQITKNIDLAIERDGKTLNILMRLLSNSGIAMSMAGNSRPASGAEHIVSHFIEMYYELNNELPLFHGIQVSLGTLISLKAYNYLFNGLDSLKVIDIDIDERKKNLTKLFGESLGNQLMEIYNMKMKKLKKPDKALIEKAKNEILPVYSEFVESAEKAISKLNLESEYSKIDEDLIRKAVMFSNSLRDRYTIFDLFDSLGLIKDFSSKCL